MQNGRRKWWILAPVILIGGGLFFGWVVMSLWNFVMVPVLHVGVISFWQGLALLVLMRILFGGMRGGGNWGGHRGGPWKDKWRNMSEEERRGMKQAWEQRCRNRGRATDDVIEPVSE